MMPTVHLKQARPKKGAASGRWLLFLAISLSLHALVLPGGVTARLRELFTGPAVGLRDLQGDTVIPIDLELEDSPASEPSRESPASSPAEPAAPAEPATLPNALAKPDAVLDGGVGPAAASGDAAVPEALRDGGDVPKPPHHTVRPVASAPPSRQEAGNEAYTVASAVGSTSQPLASPVGLVTHADALTGKQPNVSMLLHMAVLRDRAPAFAAQLGPAMSRIRQWSVFFDGSGLDPVQDTNDILIAGPQMHDTRQIVAIVNLSSKAASAKAVVSSMVSHAGGGWDDGDPPMAHATIDGVQRYFLMPSMGVVLVIPKDALAQAKGLKAPKFPKNSNGEAIVVRLKDPWRALYGVPFVIPQTLSWVRISITMEKDGSGTLHLDAEDSDSTSATQDAVTLTQGVESASTVKLGGLTIRVMDPIEFQGDGSMVRATLHVNATQLQAIGNLIVKGLETISKR